MLISALYGKSGSVDVSSSLRTTHKGLTVYREGGEDAYEIDPSVGLWRSSLIMMLAMNET